MEMTQQELLDNFVKKVNGKGQSIDKNSMGCLYFPKKHPGCAIGCQPGFREKFQSLNLDDEVEKSITSIANKYQQIKEFLGEGNLSFCQDLQEFHDSGENWHGKNLKSTQSFCDKWNLKNPLEDQK